METTVRPIAAGANAGASGPAQVPALPPARRASDASAPARAHNAPARLRGGLAPWDSQLQEGVARAQQALDYLDRLRTQLESVKGDLTARLSGARNARQLEAGLRQLGGTLAARGQQGGGVDAQLGFEDGAPAQQRFRIRGLDLAALKAAATRTLTLSVGGGPQVKVDLDADMSAAQVAQRFDRALAPLKLHASLDDEGQLLFSSAEADWPKLKDSIVLVGAGRITTDEIGGGATPQDWHTGDSDALRQSLREVVQALARVRRSQETASAALSAAIARMDQAKAPPPEQAHQLAQQFADSAAGSSYDALLALSSALVGVSRERVLALLGTP